MDNIGLIVDYIDRAHLARAVLRDYNDLCFRADRGRQEMSMIRSRMTAISAAGSHVRVSGGAADPQSAMADNIDKLTLIEDRYKAAIQLCEFIKDCLAHISDADADILRKVYIEHDVESQGIAAVMSTHHISQGEAYKRAKSALRRLGHLLLP